MKLVFGMKNTFGENTQQLKRIRKYNGESIIILYIGYIVLFLFEQSICPASFFNNAVFRETVDRCQYLCRFYAAGKQ